MLKKIETMVMGIGELSLDAISTWFPSKPKEFILKEIEKSDVIGVVNNQVMAKSKIQQRQNDNVVNKNINLATSKDNTQATKNIDKQIGKGNKGFKRRADKTIENMEKPIEEVIEEEEFIEQVQEFVEPIEESMEKAVEDEMDNIVDVEFQDDNDVSYGELVELINKYNKGVKEKYDNLVSENFENKKQGIIEYYKNRFSVVKNDFELGEGHELYSLLHKNTMLEVAYLYIGEILTKDIFDKISNTFVEETVYFCVTKNAEVNPNISNREYYQKDVNDIVKSYLSKYELTEVEYTVLKIN